nr:hypothetical protein [Tanacetum cinerariifolium]
MESIFMTGSSTVTPIPSPQSTMTPSIISTSTTASLLPIPPTPIPRLDLQNLPTFASVFHFEDRVKSLEVNFSNIPEDVMMMMIRMKDPPLDKNGGLRDGEKVSASESAFAEEPVQTISQMDEPSYLVFKTGADDQTIVQSSQHPEWFSQPKKPLTLDRD